MVQRLLAAIICTLMAILSACDNGVPKREDPRPQQGNSALAKVLAAPPARARPQGHVDFPTSGSSAAQQAFEVGVLALHNFWYEEARDHFRKAAELDPAFAMAYWGEALTHDAPLQGPRGLQDAGAGQALIDRLDELQARGVLQWSEREQNYVDALRALFKGHGSPRARKAGR